MSVIGKIGKNLKRGVIYGGLLGTLIGSQYGSIGKAYEKVLKTDIEEKEIILDYIKKNKNVYKDKATYQTNLNELQEAYGEAKDNLEDYKEMSEKDKRKEALKDVKKYGMTVKEISPTLPTSKESWKKTGKGAKTGAITGGVILTGLGIGGAVRRRKKKKSLESKLSIFLGLLAGGFGLSLISLNLTGNVVGSFTQPENIIGLILIVLGIIGSYFYFKKA